MAKQRTVMSNKERNTQSKDEQIKKILVGTLMSLQFLILIPFEVWLYSFILVI